jgi:uncharacterized membrane protein YhaH (DUF805 family)
MNMPTAVKSVLGKYLTFSGRASRSEYWWWSLALIILFVMLAVIEGAIIAPLLGFEQFASDAGQPLSLLAGLGLILPSIAVTVRRLHDTERSAWWLLVGLVPLIGNLVLLFFYVQMGTDGENQFG